MKAVHARDPDLLAQIMRLRAEVFVVEENVPPELEQDEEDASAFHAAVLDQGMVVATGRLVIHGPAGKIGRMAVKREWRGKGLGRMILAKLIAIGNENGVSRFYLHAQLHAKGFYLKEGFVPVGDVFLEAGIPHQRMEMETTGRVARSSNPPTISPPPRGSG